MAEKRLARNLQQITKFRQQCARYVLSRLLPIKAESVLAQWYERNGSPLS